MVDKKMFSKPEREVNKVYLHCSANDNEAYYGPYLKEFIRKIHVDDNKWSDIGYNLMIDRPGRILMGRSLERTPAAQKGHNTGSISIMVHGLETFTGESMETLTMLCNEINEAYNGKVSFHGHNEVSNKECPVYDYKTVLRLNKKGFMLKRKTEKTDD